nr:hypothetical protein [Dyadobacter sp. UC 10]
MKTDKASNRPTFWKKGLCKYLFENPRDSYFAEQNIFLKEIAEIRDDYCDQNLGRGCPESTLFNKKIK